jgi:hypothetical protein
VSPGCIDPDEVRTLERAILTGALGELGARAGLIGGRRGGRRGAERAARRLREDRCELTLRVNAPAEDTLRTATAVLANAGQPVHQLPTLDPPESWAVVGSGVGGLNPAVIRVTAVPLDPEHCTAIVRAVALEGLIKQHGGRKAAARIRDALARTLDDKLPPA